MDEDKKQTLFEEKYQKILGMSYGEWLEQGPDTEEQAYEWLNHIDTELKTGYDAWFEATGQLKDELEEKRDKLKAMYDFIEETFGLGIFDIER